MSTNKKPVPSVKAAVTQTAANIENFTKAGVDAARENIAITRDEAVRNQEKIVEASRDHMEQFQSGVKEISAFGKQHLETLVETGKSVTETAKELHEQLVAETNELYSENVQFSKELLACRNLGDLAEVQSRAMQSNLTRFFDTTARLTDVWFKLATTAAEPMSQQANQVAERLKKNLAA
ncbi:MAG: phasin family protein [Alphaproteobacteria bacterium]|nr:phasin family protein [Alphaproteobacteria bacterium]